MIKNSPKTQEELKVLEDNWMAVLPDMSEETVRLMRHKINAFRKQLGMPLLGSKRLSKSDIVDALNAGKQVKTKDRAYIVTMDWHGQVHLGCLANGHTVLLWGAEGTKYADTWNIDPDNLEIVVE